MTAHLSDSDRQALRLAHDLREEMRLALPQQAAAPSVSPFVDPSGRPSVLMRMDVDTARALMAVLGERREPMARPPEPRRADGTHVPPHIPPHMPPSGPPMMTAPPPTGAPVMHGGHAPLLPTAFPTR